MNRRFVWLLVSGLMVAVLALVSCGPAVTEEEEEEVVTEEEEEEVVGEEEEEEAEGPEMAKLTLTKLDGTVVEKMVEKPKYGGVLTLVESRSPLLFDEAFGHMVYTTTMRQTNETLLTGDWTRGPAGTGEASLYYLVVPSPGVLTGALAESWEITEPDTVIYHIRQGVHFHDKPPTNGREMTADDVVFTYEYLWGNPKSYHAAAYPWDKYVQSITAPDKWTVVVKAQPAFFGPLFEHTGNSTWILPREAVEAYGDLSDWRNSVGTGPFMLIDHVRESSMTFERNPNYWRKDQFFPENQLPYLDGVNIIVIPDASTRLAALRTAKIDQMFTGWEDAFDLKRTNPELVWKTQLSETPASLFGRVDKPELPFKDIRVRRALHMALDKQEIAATLYGGEAEVHSWPILPVMEFIDMYTPLDELPESSQELFRYDPEKARQLLAEAGYPDGFKTEVVSISDYVDLLSVVKDYWAKIGVELTLDVKEYGAYTSIGTQKTHKEMYILSESMAIPFRFTRIAVGQMWNYSIVNDSRIEEAKRAIDRARFDEPKRRQLMKEISLYMIDQAYYIVFPAANVYSFWQPWLKGYDGQLYTGYMGSLVGWPKYIWIDQDLKEELTGIR